MSINVFEFITCLFNIDYEYLKTFDLAKYQYIDIPQALAY